jgi:amino acid permease
MRGMFAVVWHYWVGVAVAIAAVVTLVAMVVGYLKTVESTRYPKGR